MRFALLVALAAASFSAASAAKEDGSKSSAFHVARAVRKVDASKHVVTSSTAYKLGGDLPKDGIFRVAFSAEEAPFVSTVVARFEEGGSSSGEAVQLVAKMDTAFAGSKGNVEGWAFYSIDLSVRELSGDKTEVIVDAVLTGGALVPHPKEISQFDRQLVLLKLSAYVASPYSVAKQSTTVTLPSGGSNVVESVTVDTSSGASYKQEGSSTVKFGPFKAAVEPFTSAAATIHYANNHPFATFTSVIREVEVSMWGNVAVEEHYNLLHTGAALKHGFSRIDYQSKNARGNSFHELTALLPSDTLQGSVYYRDMIGNISTSNVRHRDSRAGATVFEIEPRFPLFGGWKTFWYQGYSLPISHHVSTVAANKHSKANTKGERELELRVDASIPYKVSSQSFSSAPVSKDKLAATAGSYPIQDYTLKVILPEGATLLSVEAPFPHTLTESRRWTYLDSLYGRAVAVIKAEGTITSAGINSGDVVVRYTYPPTAIFVKPAVLVGALLAVFLSVTLLSRVDLSLGSRTAGAAAATAGSHEKRE